MKPNRLVALLLGTVLGGGSGLAFAQTITLTPSLTVSEEYDDNVLLSPTDRQSDFVTSISPGLRLTVRDPTWDVTLAASARADYYADRPELNSTTDNQSGNLAIKFRPTARFTASLTDTFNRSINPAEVNTETGIITGRFRSYRNTVTPAVTYQINPLTLIGLQYSLGILRSDSPLARDSDTHEGELSAQRQLTPRTSGTLRYTLSRFQIEASPARDVHLPRIGVAHALSPTIRISAEAGPVFIETSDGSFETTVGGTLQYTQEFSRGRLSVAYDRRALVPEVIGEVAVRQSLTATVTLPATRDVTVDLEAGIRATESLDEAVDFLVYTAAIRVDYRVLQWLAFNVGYRYLRQDDRVGSFDLDRNVVFLGVTASTDFRVY